MASGMCRDCGTKLLVKVAAIVAIASLVATAASCKAGSRASNDTTALPIPQSRFLEELEANFADGKLLKQGTLVVTEYGTDKVGLRYTQSTSTSPMTAAAAEVITKGLVKFSLDVLIAHEYNPREHTTLIAAHAYQAGGKSVTGASQVRTYGWASYDWNSDRVEFNPTGE